MSKRLRVPQTEFLESLYKQVGDRDFTVSEVGFKPGMGSMMRGLWNAGALVRVSRDSDGIATWRIHHSYASRMRQELTA